MEVKVSINPMTRDTCKEAKNPSVRANKEGKSMEGGKSG